MMVALVLGLLVVGGASMIFLATRQANGTSDNLSRMQESVRTSYDLMTREVREAGATPCVAQGQVTNVLNNAQGATPTWWAAWGEPLRGFDGVTAFAGAAIGVAVGERVAGTSALLVRYAATIDNLALTAHDTATATMTANRINHGIAAGETLLVCNYRYGALFQATAANIADGTFVHGSVGGAPGNCSAGLGFAQPALCTAAGTSFKFSAGSLVGRYIGVGWYIGNNGRPATGGRSLYRVTRLGAEEVADGVRDMQLSYLVAGNYVAPTAVTDWGLVTAVRFDVTYEGPDRGVGTGAGSPRLQRTVGFTVNLRNLQP